VLTLCETLAKFTVGLRVEDIPDRVRRKARAQVLAVLGALYGSAGNDDARTVAAAVSARGGHGPVRLLPSGGAATVEDSLLVAASATMALDFDDYVFAGHTGHSAVLVPLLLGASVGASGREALTAQIIANEVGARVGAAMLVGPLNGQMWAPIHAAAAAAAAGRLLGLDEEGVADALGIALAAPPLPLMPGFMGSGAKVLTAAHPAWMGLGAAQLAARGMRGARDVIEGRHGLLARFAYAPAPFFFGGLGREWLTDTIAFKVYPGCAYIGSTIDALLEILRQVPLAHDDVERVDVRASLVTVAMQHLAEAHAPPRLSPVNINFSIPLNVALVLRHGRLDPRVLETAALSREEATLRALAARVHVHHDWGMTLALGAAVERSLHLRHALTRLDLRGVLRARQELLGGLTLPDARSVRVALRDLWGPLFASGRRALSGTLAGGRAAHAAGDAEGYDLGRADLEDFTFPFAAHVTVRTRAGRVHEALVTEPRGTPGDWEASFRWTEEKLRREALAARPDSQPERIVDIVRRYEDHTPRELLDVL
jgi:2-methylcitrate dehydratase PrpD